MEEAIVKLLKVTIKRTARWERETPEELVDGILAEAELALHEEARQELIDYIINL